MIGIAVSCEIRCMALLPVLFPELHVEPGSDQFGPRILGVHLFHEIPE
jgi:hypothetical protein